MSCEYAGAVQRNRGCTCLLRCARSSIFNGIACLGSVEQQQGAAIYIRKTIAKYNADTVLPPSRDTYTNAQFYSKYKEHNNRSIQQGLS